MADIFDEVEENIREEKWKEWFRRFAPFGAAVVVLVVAVVAGREWQQSRKAALAAETSENYVALTAAIDARNWDEARALAETIRQSGHRGYAGFAAQMEAEAALQAGAPDIAIENLQAAAGQMPLPALADLALLKAAYLQVNEGNAQAATAIAQDLASAGRPLRAHAEELLAAMAFSEGRLNDAKDMYDLLALQPTAPEGVQRRAAEARAVLEVMLVSDETVPPAGNIVSVEDSAPDAEAGADPADMDNQDTETTGEDMP